MAVSYKKINEEISSINSKMEEQGLNLLRVAVILDPTDPKSKENLREEIKEKIKSLNEEIARCSNNEGKIHAATLPSGSLTKQRDLWIGKKKNLENIRMRLEYVRDVEIDWLDKI